MHGSGRKHHNHEVLEFDLYDSTTSAARPDGARLFTERLVAEPLRRPVRQAGAMGGYDVLGNVLVVTSLPCAEAVFERVKQGFDDHTNTVAGASRLPHDAGLLYKVLGTETEPAKAKVRSFWGLVREAVVGAALPALRSWR